MRLIKILLTLICSATFAGAAAPAAPTNFEVTPLGTNAFLLKWKDNSKDEVGWEVSAILGKSANPPRFSLVPIKDIQSFVLKTNDLPSRTITFQLRAYNGAAGAEVLSKPSKVVTVRTPGPSPFNAPSGLKTKVLDDGRIRLQWKDNANSEVGYQIESRSGKKGKWSLIGTTDPGVRFRIDLAGLAADTSYSFRVRAVRTVPVPNVTAYSNIATAKTMPFRAPAGLVEPFQVSRILP